jgi:hypothetical protein
MRAAQRSQLELQLGLALGRFGDQIDRVVGHLWDEGRRGAPDRRCLIEVDLRPHRISVEEGNTEFRVALGRAAARASRTVARALERERRVNGPVPGAQGRSGGRRKQGPEQP